MDLGPGGRGHLLAGASRGPDSAADRALVAEGARVPVDSRPAHAVDAAVASPDGTPAAHGRAADVVSGRSRTP